MPRGVEHRPRRHLEREAVVVQALDEAVDPSEAQRLTDGVLVRHRLSPRVLLVEHDPDSGSRRVVLRQPCPPEPATPNLGPRSAGMGREKAEDLLGNGSRPLERRQVACSRDHVKRGVG